MKAKSIIPPFLIVAIAGCNMPKEPPARHFNWDVAICNQVGCNHYDCDSFKQVNNTYYLYQGDTLTNQITATGGTPIIITKNKY